MLDKRPAEPSIIQRGLFGDDRGFVYSALDNMDDLGIKRVYIVENLSAGQVRAWHGHKNADTYMHVIDGVAKLAAMNMEDNMNIKTMTLSSRNPQVLFIPGGWYNGAVSLTSNTKILVFSTLTLEEVKNDDFRLAWDYVGDDIWKTQNR